MYFSDVKSTNPSTIAPMQRIIMLYVSSNEVFYQSNSGTIVPKKGLSFPQPPPFKRPTSIPPLIHCYHFINSLSVLTLMSHKNSFVVSPLRAQRVIISIVIIINSIVIFNLPFARLYSYYYSIIIIIFPTPFLSRFQTNLFSSRSNDTRHRIIHIHSQFYTTLYKTPTG